MADAATPCLTDSQSNSTPLEGRGAFDLTPSPIWLEHAGAVPDVQLGEPVDAGRPAESSRALTRFDALADWQLDSAPLAELEALNVGTPVKPCVFELGLAPGRTPGTKALAITLKDEPGVSPHRLRYAVLRPKAREIVIPAGASRLGAWVRGNGAAWLDLELRDAKGERVPQWAHWRHQGGDGILDLPARLTGLILEQYGQVLYINQMAPPSSPTWLIGDLLCE